MRLNSPHINIITKACMKASRLLIRDYGEIENLQVSTKGPGDFVTSADKRTEKILIEELQKAHPDYGIITEETGIINKSNTKNRWIIDPIDGTMNFMNGIPQFAISIGYEENSEIKCGVIFDPIKNEMFCAEKGNGAYIYDLDGNKYIDYIGSWGPMILGHANSSVVKSVKKAIKNSTSFGAPTLLETKLANLIKKSFPSMEKMRMTSSGTEATMSAIRLARGCTNRDKIVKFEGCYHGHVDSLLVNAGSGSATFGVPSSPGIPKDLTKHTYSLEYNNVEHIENCFKRNGNNRCSQFEEQWRNF